MPVLQDALKPYELCRQLLAETDPVSRTQAIGNLRDLIESQRQAPHSSQDADYLEVTSMVVDFLEEALTHASRTRSA